MTTYDKTYEKTTYQEDSSSNSTSIRTEHIDKIEDMLAICDPTEMDTRIFKNTLNISRILKTFYRKLSDNFHISKEETEVLLYCLKFVDMLNIFMNQQSIDSLNKIIYDINELVLMINNIDSKDIILKKIRYTEMTVIYYKKKMFKNLFFGDGNALGQEIERCLDMVTLSGSFDQKLFKQMQNVFYVMQTRIEESYRAHIQERFNEMKIISLKHKKGRYNCYEEFDDYADYKNFSHHDKDTQDYYDNFNEGENYSYGNYSISNSNSNSMPLNMANSAIGYDNYENSQSSGTNYYGGYNSSYNYNAGKTGSNSNTSGKYKKNNSSNVNSSENFQVETSQQNIEEPNTFNSNSNNYQIPKIDDTMEIVTTVQTTNPKSAQKTPQNYYNDNFYKNYVYYYDKNSPQASSQNNSNINTPITNNNFSNNMSNNINSTLANRKSKTKNKRKTGGIAQNIDDTPAITMNNNIIANTLNNTEENNTVNSSSKIEVNLKETMTTSTSNAIDLSVNNTNVTNDISNTVSNTNINLDPLEIISVQVASSKGRYSNPNYKGNASSSANPSYKYGTYNGANSNNYYNSYNNNYAPNYTNSKYYSNTNYQQGRKDNYYNYTNNTNTNTNSNYYNSYSNTKTYKNEVDSGNNNLDATMNAITTSLPHNNPLSNSNSYSASNANTNLLNYRKHSNSNSSSGYNSIKYGSKNKRESYGYSSGGNSGKYNNNERSNGHKHEFVEFEEINHDKNIQNTLSNNSAINSSENKTVQITGETRNLAEEALSKEDQLKNGVPVNNTCIPKEEFSSKGVQGQTSTLKNNLVDIDVEMMFANDKHNHLESNNNKDNLVVSEFNANISSSVNPSTHHNNIQEDEYKNLAAAEMQNNNEEVNPRKNDGQGSESFEEEEECDDSINDEMDDVEDLNDEEINQEINRLRNEEEEEEEDSDSIDNEMIEAEFDKFIRESKMVGANKNFSEDYYTDREKETKNNKVIFEDDIDAKNKNEEIPLTNQISEKDNKEENATKINNIDNVDASITRSIDKEENSSNSMKETTRNFMESLKSIDPQVLMEIRGKLNEEGKKTEESTPTSGVNSSNNNSISNSNMTSMNMSNMHMNMAQIQNLQNSGQMPNMQAANLGNLTNMPLPNNMPPNYEEFLLHQRQYNKVPIQNYIFSNYAHFFYRGRDANIHREYFALKCLEQENSSLVTKNVEHFENKILIPIYQRINFNVNKKRGVYFYTFTKYKKLIYRILGKDKILKKVKPYGSYMNNFLIDSGDIDICIVPKCGILEFSNYLEKIKEEITTQVRFFLIF